MVGELKKKIVFTYVSLHRKNVALGNLFPKENKKRFAIV